MSNTARKARKKAGIKFEKTPKTPTPLEERAVARSLAPKRQGLPSNRALRTVLDRQRTLTRTDTEPKWFRRATRAEVAE